MLPSHTVSSLGDLNPVLRGVRTIAKPNPPAMRLRVLLASLSLLWVLAFSVAAPTAYPTEPCAELDAEPEPTPSVTTVEKLKEVAGATSGEFDDDPSDFDVIFYLIGLTKLSTFDAAVAGTPYTMFAPNDGAFIRLAQDFRLVGADASEEEALAALTPELELIASAAGRDIVDVWTRILNYHIAPVKLDQDALLKVTEIETFARGLTIKRGQDGVERTELTDNSDVFKNPKLISTDFFAFEGVIHTIDRLLLIRPEQFFE